MTQSKDKPGIDKAWHAALGQLTGGMVANAGSFYSDYS